MFVNTGTISSCWLYTKSPLRLRFTVYFIVVCSPFTTCTATCKIVSFTMEVIHHSHLIFNPRWRKHLSGWLNVDWALQQGERKKRRRMQILGGAMTLRSGYHEDHSTEASMWVRYRTHTNTVTRINLRSFLLLMDVFTHNSIIKVTPNTPGRDSVICYPLMVCSVYGSNRWSTVRRVANGNGPLWCIWGRLYKWCLGKSILNAQGYQIFMSPN